MNVLTRYRAMKWTQNVHTNNMSSFFTWIFIESCVISVKCFLQQQDMFTCRLVIIYILTARAGDIFGPIFLYAHSIQLTMWTCNCLYVTAPHEIKLAITIYRSIPNSKLQLASSKRSISHSSLWGLPPKTRLKNYMGQYGGLILPNKILSLLETWREKQKIKLHS